MGAWLGGGEEGRKGMRRVGGGEERKRGKGGSREGEEEGRRKGRKRGGVSVAAMYKWDQPHYGGFCLLSCSLQYMYSSTLKGDNF